MEKLTDLEKALIERVAELNERVEMAEDYRKWWSEERDRREALEEKIKILELQLEEIAQAKTTSCNEATMLTDTAAKGVL